MAFFKKLINKFRKDMISSYVGEICSIHKHNNRFIGKLTNVDIDEDGNVRCLMEQYFHSWHENTNLYFIDYGLIGSHYVKSIHNVKRLNNAEREVLRRYERQNHLRRVCPNMGLRGSIKIQKM